ncbi:YbfB/YjiJ family MFS transporter [Synechococcus sp. MU1648]|uniref:MFS transporter n=1 Tax=Synechococcus sp. MU1648 TaxID=2508351 RepID=UPI002026B1B7|nr:YbfB/YjiJ family MFS transporter [Synechococcus sp. MU1648]
MTHSAINKESSYDYLGVIAASSALAIGVGLQRTELAVLGNMMVESDWITSDNIGQLVGLNLAGYLAGCVHQTRLKREDQSLRMIRIALIVCIVTFFIEPLFPSMGWNAIWRLVSGWGCAHLVTGLPGFGTRRLHADQKRLAMGIIFAGAGIAPLLDSVLLPFFVKSSPVAAWDFTGIFSILFAVPIWMLISRGLSEERDLKLSHSSDQDIPSSATQEAISAKSTAPSTINWTPALKIFALTTLLYGASQVSILTYQPLYLTSVFKVSSEVASSSFALVGFGYTLGAIVAGLVPKKIPTDSVLLASVVIGTIGTCIFVFSPIIAVVNLGAFLFAFWNGAYIGLIVARLSEVVGPRLVRPAWALFSFLLSIGFVAMTFIAGFISTFSVTMIFYIGLALVVINLILMSLTATAFKKQNT